MKEIEFEKMVTRRKEKFLKEVFATNINIDKMAYR